jgi:predicted O-methyltransferase YrrM
MKFEVILEKIGHLPATENANGKLIFDFIIEKKIENILEIGFFHGKSTNFMAAALDELGRGKVVTIDLTSAKQYNPNIDQLSTSTGLAGYIQPIYSPMGSQWEMRGMVKAASADGRCEPQFDLCFIDAFHSWERAGMDFFLAEKLLKPGAWVVLDDLTWSFGASPTWRNLPETLNMPLDYRSAHQVGDVFELLVKQHPSFENFSIVNNWGFAQKKPS